MEQLELFPFKTHVLCGLNFDTLSPEKGYHCWYETLGDRGYCLSLIHI